MGSGETGGRPRGNSSIAHDGSRRVRENFDRSNQDNEESIPILESKGAEGQKTIKSTPDGHWVFKKGREREARHYLEWSSHLLITAGQRNSTARLTATASDTKYLGQTWFPVVGLSPDEAKAIAVFTNSTLGRLQIMRGSGKTLAFPSYSPWATNNLKVPDIKDDRIRHTLADCWERTKDMVVPQFRDGECDQAVCAGFLSRISKIMVSVAKLSSGEEHGEVVPILNRCILESSVDLQYLLKKNDDAVFERFVKVGLKSERELYDIIQKNITNRNGQELEIERDKPHVGRRCGGQVPPGMRG